MIDRSSETGPEAPSQHCSVTTAVVLAEIRRICGWEWFEILCRTHWRERGQPFRDSMLAYESTQMESKPLEAWTAINALQYLVDKRILYLTEFLGRSGPEAQTQVRSEFEAMDLGLEVRHCQYCDCKMLPFHDLNDWKIGNWYLNRSYCSAEHASEAQWLKGVQMSLEPGAAFDSSVTREAVWQRFGPFCYLCGLETWFDQKDLLLRSGSRLWRERWGKRRRYDWGWDAVVEHVKPRSKGGGHTWDNVRIACTRCNLKKGDRNLGVPMNIQQVDEQSDC
jgi:hypothetical protein